ncbi:hypothetical protein [Rheinheimera maricola]|nr:hypothetical protein [Rheinheimera maricola]
MPKPAITAKHRLTNFGWFMLLYLAGIASLSLLALLLKYTLNLL